MSIKQQVLLFLKGIGMGSADLVPGVSGGTIAFITGIYEELVDSIRSIDLNALQLLLKGRVLEFWKAINGSFLFTVFSGILIALLSLARLFSFILENYPIQMWSFFAGLILISAIVVLRKIGSYSPWLILGGVLGLVIGFLVTRFTPSQTPEEIWFIFLTGVIAITAMIMPGISGSFILVILGKYEFILNAVKEFKFSDLLVFVVGCIVGLLSFSRVISWTFRKFHDITVAVLSGFMIGSLNKIWPWKEVILYRLNSEGHQVPLFDRNILPGDYLEITGGDPKIFQAILFFAIGIFIVVAMERVAAAIKA